MNKYILFCLSSSLVLASLILADENTFATDSCLGNVTGDTKAPVEVHNTSCINIQLAARLKIDGNTFVSFKNGSVVNQTSQCDKNLETIDIKYQCAELHLSFTFNETTQLKSLEEIDGNFRAHNTSGTFRLTKPILNFPNGTNFRCNTEQSFNVVIKLNTTESTGLLFLSDLKIDAFNQRSDNKFNLTDDHVCNLDSSDWVQWVVFMCLVGLVVIVLVAYFVGRRRWSERSSYESV